MKTVSSHAVTPGVGPRVGGSALIESGTLDDDAVIETDAPGFIAVFDRRGTVHHTEIVPHENIIWLKLVASRRIIRWLDVTVAHFSAELLDLFLDHHMSERLGQPDDIAAAAAFSDEAAFINGALLPVDGGFTTRLGAVPALRRAAASASAEPEGIPFDPRHWAPGM